MQTFEFTKKVADDDLDALNHVNNVRYVQWVQDIAEKHWTARTSETILNNYFWVMLSHHIQYKQPALLDDMVMIKTYVIKSEGVTSTRVVEFFKGETLLAKSETQWCFMSKGTLKPTRITDEIKNLFE